MSVENLINIVRLGRQLTPEQSRAVITQLERIPAMERTIKALDHDFAKLSVAYSAAASRAEATVPFTRDECGYVCEALEESERLKEAVRVMMRAKRQGVSAYTAALKAVEELI